MALPIFTSTLRQRKRSLINRYDVRLIIYNSDREAIEQWSE
ncbi:hypothetical protein [Chroococcidiopsis sp. CCNUC1]|nr:hypothetical protein [Chroococcidiopsis sp. CCNUC1]